MGVVASAFRRTWSGVAYVSASTSPFAANSSSRSRGLAGLAVPRRDGACLLAARAGRRTAGASLPDVLRAERDGHAVLDAERRGRFIRAVAGPRAPRAVPRSDARAVRD